jgi:hypothetical protein
MGGRDSLTYPLPSFQLMQCNTAALYANLFIRLSICKTRILDHLCGVSLCFYKSFCPFSEKVDGRRKIQKNAYSTKQFFKTYFNFNF